MTKQAEPDIVCSAPACPATRIRLSSDPWDSYARAAGWHIYRQKNHADQVVMETALCPDHAGNAKGSRKTLPIEGEQQLW